MPRILSLVLTAVFLLVIASCSSPSTNRSTNTATTSSTPTTTTNAATPAATNPAATPSPGAPTTASVKASNFKWVDDASGNRITTIKVGGKVTWTKIQGDHTLERVAPSTQNGCGELDASFDSDLDQPVTKTFTKAGIYGYHCGIHKGNPNCKTPESSTGMSAIIKVEP